MSPPSSASPDADFVRVMSRKFEQGRFLIVGGDAHKIQSQFAEAKREAVACSIDELISKLSQQAATTHFETTVWFYPSDRSDDERVSSALLGLTDKIVLMPSPGADATKRRADLVRAFGCVEFMPEYTCDLTELNAGALCLGYAPRRSAVELARGAEAAFARLNRQTAALRHTLELRGSELDDAHEHIAALEGKLLKLKEYQRELKQLKEERRRLRKSPERRVGQVLLAPYRLPSRLAKSVWKRIDRERQNRATTEYQKWFEQHRAKAEDLERMRDRTRTFASQPLISIITPVFDTPVSRLEEAVQSVMAQAYEKWQLLLIDDGSTDPDLLRILPELAQRDRRIVLSNLEKHGGISAASNRGLELAGGEWITFLDHDDVLEPDALFQIVNVLQEDADVDLVYSDEDKLGQNGFEAPLFKPDWSPDFFLSYNYVGHLTAVRRDLVQKAGGFRSRFDSAQDYDLFFRVTELTSRIHHIPRVLYHWRRTETSSSISVRQKPEQLDSSRDAIEDHLKRRGEAAHVTVDWRTHAFRVRRELSDRTKISIIIPNFHGDEALKRCVESLTAKTEYPNYEILIVRSNNSLGTPSRLSDFPYRVFQFPAASNDSATKNYGAKEGDAPWLLFLDDRVEIVDAKWLTVMAEHVQRPEVGAVGARLLNSTGMVEHAGIVVGVNGISQAAFYGFPADHPGTNRQLQITRNCSAVSSACVLMRRDVFQQAGGFDLSLSGALADVDFCLKIRRADYLIVYTPFAKLHWHATHDDNQDTSGDAILRQRWANVLERDPYYNPNLSRERADFSLQTS
ncbi:MAG TPA: glycosyltransferase [Candidatus Udaeobacter sp.]|nr:glycosyltransferase [Candidatus Udaeobacter sp.]